MSFLATSLDAAQFHIRTDGKPGGTGSSKSAWSLAYALSQPGLVRPGDTLWLHGGTYQGQFISRLNGTAALPIFVRQYPGERAILDGGNDPQQRATLLVAGTYTWFWGFEIWSSDPTRISHQPMSDPTDINMGPAVLTMQAGSSGTGCKFINLYVHDSMQGMGLWVQARDLEVYGCQILFNGWSSTNVWGHGIYIQNQYGSKIVQDNIFYGNLGYAIHAYTGETDYLNNLTFTGNAIAANCLDISSGQARNNTYVGGSGIAPNLVFKNNYLYLADNESALTGATFGLPDESHENATIDSNCFIGGKPALRFDRFASGSIRGNTILGKETWVEFYPANPLTSYDWDFNGYFGQATGSYRWPFNYMDNEYSFDEWRSRTGKDPNGTASTVSPAGTRVFVRPNRYERGRANLIVYNWGNNSTVTVNADAVGLAEGDSYQLINVQNMGYVKTGTVAGGKLVVPMSGWSTPQKPNGISVPVQDLLPQFGTFVVAQILPSPRATLKASADTVLRGSTVTLTWNSADGEVATLDPGIGDVGVNGSAVIRMDSTRTFTLTVANRSASQSVAALVTVMDPPAGTFSTSPDTLPVGGGTTLVSWTSQNAVSANLDPGVGQVALSGAESLYVRSTTEFTLTLVSPVGVRKYSSRVYVRSVPLVPYLSSPSNGEIVSRSEIQLKWQPLSDASAYWVQVSRDSVFTNLVLDDSSVLAPPRRAGPFGADARYFWRAAAGSANGWSAFSLPFVFVTDAVPPPNKFELMQNYPNPFNETTTIRFALPTAGVVELVVRDLLGRDVTRLGPQHFDAGFHEISLSAASLSSGTYFLTFLAGSFVATRKMLLVK